MKERTAGAQAANYFMPVISCPLDSKNLFCALPVNTESLPGAHQSLQLVTASLAAALKVYKEQLRAHKVYQLIESLLKAHQYQLEILSV